MQRLPNRHSSSKVQSSTSQVLQVCLPRWTQTTDCIQTAAGLSLDTVLMIVLWVVCSKVIIIIWVHNLSYMKMKSDKNSFCLNWIVHPNQFNFELSEYIIRSKAVYSLLHVKVLKRALMRSSGNISSITHPLCESCWNIIALLLQL